MRAAASVLTMALATSVVMAPRSAEAQIEGDPVIVMAAVLGTLGGLTNSIAATVYAVDGRALGSGWVVSSLFSSAVCAAVSFSFVVSAADGNAGAGTIVGVLFYGFLAGWPAYSVIRSAWSDAEPGDYFDAEVAPEETDDPITSLDIKPRSPPIIAAFTFEF